ncbi:hypothetical protein Hypma_004292 [Hypsizygus marmoreus]|uniref:MYND-type domain-containing protein n=1 Tax=Hypsizygus marmoreus TaxID=39966 RepID=A0A369K0Z7_HYPMA|nr:hypothetical protein Hypma_004292 [Hypsizygus marmoreus]
MRRRRRPYEGPQTPVGSLDDILSLTGANPLKIMTVSDDACAASTLIQYRMFRDYGVCTSVDSLFDAPPETLPEGPSRERYLARKSVIAWFKAHERQWTPILYRYEIVKASAKRERDWGHLIFVDMSLCRFLLVMVYPSICDCGECGTNRHDYEAMTKYHAHRFMSLLKCVYHDLEIEGWVRATYTTPEQNYTLDPKFASPFEPPDINSTEDAGSIPRPPIICVKSDNFVPCLLLSELEKIDNLRAQDLDSPGQSIPPHVRAQVLGSKDARPGVGSVWQQRNSRRCSHCGILKEKNLMLCSKCKLDYYCGRECQKLAWPSHKRFCRQG